MITTLHIRGRLHEKNKQIIRKQRKSDQVQTQKKIKVISTMTLAIPADSATEHAFTFWELYATLLFATTVWTAGKAVTFAGFPASSGEVLCGILLGPGLGNLISFDARGPLMLCGEIGLYMLVLEAGVEVDLAMLKLLGLRGLAVAVLGSLFPLALGLGLGRCWRLRCGVTHTSLHARPTSYSHFCRYTRQPPQPPQSDCLLSLPSSWASLSHRLRWGLPSLI